VQKFLASHMADFRVLYINEMVLQQQESCWSCPKSQSNGKCFFLLSHLLSWLFSCYQFFYLHLFYYYFLTASTSQVEMKWSSGFQTARSKLP
jgi:hypothetical protein